MLPAQILLVSYPVTSIGEGYEIQRAYPAAVEMAHREALTCEASHCEALTSRRL
jgi:hypothetical protein